MKATLERAVSPNSEPKRNFVRALGTTATSPGGCPPNLSLSINSAMHKIVQKLRPQLSSGYAALAAVAFTLVFGGCQQKPVSKVDSQATTPAGQHEQLPTSTKGQPQTLTTVTDFERSAFCVKYDCKQRDTWSLQDGSTNHSYHVSVPHVIIELQDANNRVSGFGLIFYERERLSDDDLQFVASLFQSADTTISINDIMTFVRTNVETAVCSSCSVPSDGRAKRYGNFEVRVGKSGLEQVIAIRRTT